MGSKKQPMPTHPSSETLKAQYVGWSVSPSAALKSPIRARTKGLVLPVPLPESRNCFVTDLFCKRLR
jgi:hypothetical protein